MTCKINNDQRHHPAEKQPTTCRKKPRARVPAFPQQLYAMVDHAERCGYSHIVSWHPDGRAFQIRDEQALVKTILVQYFNKQTRYKSFLRQLQKYGFTRIYKGPQRGMLQHPLFQRGRHELLDGKFQEDFRTAASTISGVGWRLNTGKAVSTSMVRFRWDERRQELANYKKVEGHCNVPVRSKKNKQLGIWVGNQRQQYILFKEGKKSSMTTEMIQSLNDLGFMWKSPRKQGKYHRFS